ncbi:MAG: DegT/DnrJ/EryC1/StrS family aminotransferase [Treponema sp.]|nr:DegT/DnrJ/EryC1/StrS family aminotransferase [Treponema sp.]
MDAVLTAMVEDQVGPGEHTRFLIHTVRDILGFDYCLALRSPVFALQLALQALAARADGAETAAGSAPGAGFAVGSGPAGNVSGNVSGAGFAAGSGPAGNVPGNVSGDGAAAGNEADAGIPKGRGVIVSALSPLYYDRVIRGLGLYPIYCDTAADSPLMDREKLEALLEAKPLCVVFHETLGYLPGAEFFEGLGFPVIEDCSQSAGAVLGGRKAGSFGTLAILGLEERDMITAGGGALLFAGSRRDAAPLRALGELPPEYLLPDVNAAMAAVQFREGEKNLARRRELGEAYVRSSLQTRHKRFREAEGLLYNNYAFSLILESGARDVKSYAKKKEIAVEEALELTLAGSGALPSAQCPCASSLTLRTLRFPLYPRLGAAQADRVAKLIMTLP